MNKHTVSLKYLRDASEGFYERIGETLPTKQEALRILGQAGLSREELKKIQDTIRNVSKATPHSVESNIGSIVKSVSKTLNVAPLVVAAVMALSSPAQAQDQGLMSRFHLPPTIVNIVKAMPQPVINLMGVGGFQEILHKHIKDSMTDTVLQELAKVPEKQRADTLTKAALAKIESDTTLSGKFSNFMQNQGLSQQDMYSHVLTAVNEQLPDINKRILGISKELAALGGPGGQNPRG